MTDLLNYQKQVFVIIEIGDQASLFIFTSYKLRNYRKLILKMRSSIKPLPLTRHREVVEFFIYSFNGFSFYLTVCIKKVGLSKKHLKILRINTIFLLANYIC